MYNWKCTIINACSRITRIWFDFRLNGSTCAPGFFTIIRKPLRPHITFTVSSNGNRHRWLTVVSHDSFECCQTTSMGKWEKEKIVSLISVSADLICHGFECAMCISISITFNRWHNKLLAMCKASRYWTNYIEAISVFNVHITHEYTTCCQNHFKWTHVVQSMDQWSAFSYHHTHASSHSSAFRIIRFGFFILFSHIYFFFVGVTFHSTFKCRLNLFPAYSNTTNNNNNRWNSLQQFYRSVRHSSRMCLWSMCALAWMCSFLWNSNVRLNHYKKCIATEEWTSIFIEITQIRVFFSCIQKQFFIGYLPLFIYLICPLFSFHRIVIFQSFFVIFFSHCCPFLTCYLQPIRHSTYVVILDFTCGVFGNFPYQFYDLAFFLFRIGQCSTLTYLLNNHHIKGNARIHVI